MDDNIYETLIESKVNGTFKDVTKLLNNKEALDYTADNIIKQLGEHADEIDKIVCPFDDDIFANFLAEKMKIEVIKMNPYEGTCDKDISKGEKAIIVGTALCGGSLYYSMFSLLEYHHVETLGFVYIVEKVWHRGRYKLADSITSPLPLGVISAIKYGATTGIYVKFDCSKNNLGIRIFKVLSLHDNEAGVNWLDGPRPCEKKFPIERIIEISFNRKDWFKYHN